MATLKNTIVSSTGAATLSVGTTAQRPASPVVGMLRYNSTDSKLEWYNGTSWLYTAPVITPVTNLISNPSVESDSAWSYSVSSRSTTYSLFGNYSIYFPNRSGSGLNMNTQSMPTPTANHIYYGGRYIYSAGATVTAADDRFEWFLGDGANLQMVFAANQGTFSSWTLQTTRTSLSAPVSGSWGIRHFTVNQNGGNLYTDGHFIINLTSTFGSGNEPSKAWCDAYYNFAQSAFIAYQKAY